MWKSHLSKLLATIIFVSYLALQLSGAQAVQSQAPPPKTIGEASATKAAVPAATTASELSPQQNADIAKIISEAKQHGNLLAERLAANAKLFDEVLLADRADIEGDAKAANGIKTVLNEAAETRLEAARKVVHLLTAEQRRYLKAEMAKPDSEKGILEAAAKIFHIQIGD